MRIAYALAKGDSMTHDGIGCRFTLIACIITACCYGKRHRALSTSIVRDTSGGLIAEATVRAINLSTNLAVTTETNAEGNYSLGYLLPGDYNIVVNKPGFKQFERNGVKVAVNDRLTLNVAMEIGQVSE